MRIYTSYFAKIKKVVNPIAICGKSPDWYTGPQYKKLAPKYGFFMDYKNGVIDEVGYTKCFNELVLLPLSQEDIIKELSKLYEGEEEITLLCYEKPTDFCHRHIVAEWLNRIGLEVKEKEI